VIDDRENSSYMSGELWILLIRSLTITANKAELRRAPTISELWP